MAPCATLNQSQTTRADALGACEVPLMSKTILILIALFIPPLAMFLHCGLGKHFWINLILTILGFGIGGIIHAIYVIANEA